MTGSVTLSRYPLSRLRLACDRCNRHGDYSTVRMIKQYGPDYRLPDLKADLTAGCPGRQDYGSHRCDAVFVDLHSRIDELP